MTSDKGEPQEYWILPTKELYKYIVRMEPFGASGLVEQPIHVIKYSAFDKLKTERDELKFELEAKQRPLGEQVLNLTLELDKLKAENDRLREALEKIKANRYGLQGLIEDHADYSEIANYWAREAMGMQEIAREALKDSNAKS